MESFKEHLSQMAEGVRVDTDVDTRVDTDAQPPPPPVDNRDKEPDLPPEEPEEEPEVEEGKKKYEGTPISVMLARLQARRPDIKV